MEGNWQLSSFELCGSDHYVRSPQTPPGKHIGCICPPVQLVITLLLSRSSPDLTIGKQ